MRVLVNATGGIPYLLHTQMFIVVAEITRVGGGVSPEKRMLGVGVGEHGLSI